MRTFCGIDIGLSGGVAVIQDSGEISLLKPMYCRKNQQGKNEIDSAWLYQHLRELAQYVAIEYVHSFGHEGRTSCFSFGTSNGKVRAVLEILGLPFVAVTPQAWKKVILEGTQKDKAAAIGYCEQRWPDVDLKQGSSQYKDGLSDSLCLAEYARRQVMGV